MKRISVVVVLCLVAPCSAEEQYAEVNDSLSRVSLKKQDSYMLLHAGETANAFGWVSKVVKLPRKEGQNGLLTFCRNERGGLCVPVRLGTVRFLETSKGLFVDADVVAKALRFEVLDKNGKVTLLPLGKKVSPDTDIPSYNADWGKGRGFRVGQTLPDIPLYDLNGKETRFSQFLGKQYILYCWASW